MIRFSRFLIFAAVLLCAACAHEKPSGDVQKTVGTSTHIEGDSTLYGLACDGCTDSVLVFLPGKGGDPVAFDIIQAMKRRRVIGRPKVGDWVAVIPNPTDSTKADMVIDLDELKGEWVQMVKPELRQRMNIPGQVVDPEEKAEMDSAIRKLMQPVEIGFALKRHYTAQPIGLRFRNSSGDDDSPVVYPVPRRYAEWHVFNGKLVLTVAAPPAVNGDSAAVQPAESDTAEFVLLLRDSLRLRFSDGERGYYRK